MMEVENNANKNGLESSKERERRGEGAGSSVGWHELVLRGLALLLTLVAAILMGVNKQTKTVPISISPDLPPFNVPVTAKYTYLSAFVYFVVVNSIACAIAAGSLALTFASKGKRGGSLLTIFVVDLIMLALLFSGIGATGAVGLIGYKGNSHVQWKEVCNVFGKFCHQTMSALALSLVGAVAYMLLLLLTASKLHRKA